MENRYNIFKNSLFNLINHFYFKYYKFVNQFIIILMGSLYIIILEKLKIIPNNYNN